MNIAINPGTECIDNTSWENAYENINQFIKDCEIPMQIVKADFGCDRGRYLFVLKAENIPDYEVEVEMPGLPLNEVRYIDDKTQNIWNFPRLYVDGASWVWRYAIIKKECVIEQIETMIEDHEDTIKLYKKALELVR